MTTTSKSLIALLVAAGIGLAGMPVAAADPIGDADDDIYGLVTPGESQEIWANGNRNCVILDQAGGTTDAVGALTDQYQAQDWDLESASDIVWESVSARCREYLDAVKRAVRTYGDPS